MSKATGPNLMNDVGTWIIYDGECPFCTNYVALMQLRNSIGDVSLLDARKFDPVVQMVIDRGYDLNEGMVVVHGGTVFHGEDAIVFISLLSGNVGMTGQILRWILRDRRRASFLYPIMKFGRRVTLAALGRSPIKGILPKGRTSAD